MFMFRNSIGVFVIDDISVREEHLLDSPEEIARMESSMIAKGISPADHAQTATALRLLSQKKYFDLLRCKATAATIRGIGASVCPDNMIIQSINNIDELHKTINTLVKRLREWFGYYIPEIVEKTEDNEAFVTLVLSNTRQQLMERFNVTASMGGDFSDSDVSAMLELAKSIKNLFALRDASVTYLESVMKKRCPNLMELAGATIGAKLLEQAGSLERLSSMPSSTVQVLGAEKALFRHLRTGSRPPKYGFIINHPFVMSAQASNRGKVARMLADKISMAVKVDYFRGEFIGDKLRQSLEKRVGYEG